MTSVVLYDTTLRDGAQREGISFSVTDKLKIAAKLDELGIHYIEGGWPGSNPKDAEFFARARDLKLVRSRLAAFGSTRRPGVKAARDANLQALLQAGTTVVTIVGKASLPQVKLVLECPPEENLAMITDSIRYLKSRGLTVFFDAEHFFDGFKSDDDYSLNCLEAAASAGADALVLCDTNGGSLPGEVTRTIELVRQRLKTPLGIHAHNDGDLAVANSLAAVEAGAAQVQGTINGYGERCGNANLCSIIPDLKLKMGIDCLYNRRLARLTDVSRFVSELANLTPDAHLPYVGSAAFGHKGGLHVAGIVKWPDAYQHTDPARVGNQPRVMVSELSGRGNIVYKAAELGIRPPSGPEAKKLLEHIKLRESQGFQYDHAEASFELLVRRAQRNYVPPFVLVDFMVVIEKKRRVSSTEPEEMLSEAMVKVRVKDEIMHTAAEGNGPVNALDAALRKSLVQFFPGLARIKLLDYKVRILEESVGTGSTVRVLIESGDGVNEWRTVGSSTNIIEASWLALADSLEYWLIRHEGKPQ